MTTHLGIHYFLQELKVVLSDKNGEKLQVYFPSKSAVKKKVTKRAHSIEKNPWRF
jgi:hypothetical protein